MLSKHQLLHYAYSVSYSEDMKKNKIGLQALQREAISTKTYRLCFIAILLQGSSAHGWETNQPAHNAYHLKESLKSTDPKIKKVAKSLLNCDPRVVRNIAPLLSKPKGDLQTAGLDLAHIATTKSIDATTTHAVLALAELLQDTNSSKLEKAQELIEELKNTEKSSENSAIAQEASAIHRQATASK
jgi:hypothetical protein